MGKVMEVYYQGMAGVVSVLSISKCPSFKVSCGISKHFSRWKSPAFASTQTSTTVSVFSISPSTWKTTFSPSTGGFGVIERLFQSI